MTTPAQTQGAGGAAGNAVANAVTNFQKNTTSWDGNTLSQNGTRVPFAKYDQVVPPATGSAATDTANINAAISACPENGIIYVPHGEYLLNATIVIGKSLKIFGAGVFDIQNNPSTALPDNPVKAPWLGGTVFRQTAAGADCFLLNGASRRVDLADFGIVFDPTIAFTNTGHGINATAPTIAGGANDTGLITSRWDNISIWGHDGNHYGRVLTNPMHNTMTHIRSHGGGVIKIVANSTSISYGNIVDTHSFGALFCAGSADAFHLEGPSGVGWYLNLCVFVRPQCNISNLSAVNGYTASTVPTNAQSLWVDINNVRDCSVIAPDLENDAAGVTCPINFGPATYVTAGGGYMVPVPAYVERKRNRPATQPAITILAGGGTATASFTDGNADDDSGIIQFSVPAGANLPGSDLFTVTFTNPKKVAPKFVHVWVQFCTANPGELFVITASSTTGFTVRGVPAPPNGGSWQIAYRVEP